MAKARVQASRFAWGDALARAMAASRYCRTQTALARKSGVGQTTIGRILRGEVDPQLGTLALVAAALGIPLQTLAGLAEGERSVEGPKADQLEIDRAEQELDEIRGQINSSIDRLRQIVAQRGCRPNR
jgi:transcriptional regulator with XRE-family HTH domain